METSYLVDKVSIKALHIDAKIIKIILILKYTFTRFNVNIKIKFNNPR
jgi:hypothetical protein